MDYKDRLLNEFEDLFVKIIKLQIYIDEHEIIDNILREQYEVMMQYLDILRKRIIDAMNK